MASVTSAVCVYQETCLSLESPGPLVHISLADGASSSFISRDSPKRRRVDRHSAFADESAYASSHLASDSSIYFRTVDDPHSPASILWRVLDNDTTLELQSVDLLSKTKDQSPALTTLRFALPDAIIPSGVLFASQENIAKSDTLTIFIFTQKPDLYRLTLKKEAFAGTGYFDDNTPRSSWLTKCTPAVFSYRKPYRAALQSAKQLWISLSDGGLVEMKWDTYEHGNKWSETNFSESSWGGSLLGIIRKSHPSVKYGNVEVDSRAATTIAPSPSGNIMWTVCLDGTLRAWDIKAGKAFGSWDISTGAERDPRHPADQPLDPHQPCLVQLEMSRSPGSYQLVTFSPFTQAFKFWTVSESEPKYGPVHVDIREENTAFKFMPPVDELLQIRGWRMDQFHLIPPKDGRSHHRDLWLLVRCGGKSHVLHLNFNPSAKLSELRPVWNSAWSRVNHGPSSIDELKTLPTNPRSADPQQTVVGIPSVTEKWAEFIMAPGRFPHELLQTALGVYRRGLTERAAQNINLSPHSSLAEEICLTVGASLVMQTTSDVRQNLQAYESDIAIQWNTFYGLVEDLQKQRERPLSLALDYKTRSPWVVAADQVSPIRSCCLLECLWANKESLDDFQPTKSSHNPLAEAIQFSSERVHAGQLLNVLSLFRNGLPKPFLESFRSMLLADILHPTRISIQERMMALYTESGFHGQLGDDDYNKVLEAIDLLGGFEGLTNGPFEILIQALTSGPAGEDAGVSVAPFGFRLLIQGAKDTLRLGLEVLLDVALFTIFTAVELDPSDVSEQFLAEDLFELLGPRVLEYEMLDFIATTNYSKADVAEGTIIEEIVGTSRKPPAGIAVQTWLLTQWIRTWTFTLTEAVDLDQLGTNILAHLVRDQDIAHAESCLKFVFDSPWATYVRGRFYLTAGQMDSAAQCFIDAAAGLSENFEPKNWDRAGLLQPFHRLHFGQGFMKYYQHVLSLFEQHSCMSYVSDFARLALEHTSADDKENLSSRTDILSRLSAASIQTLRFQDAFDALLEYTDQVLRRAALQALMNALISSSRIRQLVMFPFPDDLAAEADGHIASLAANPKSTPQFLAKSLAGPAADETPILPPHQILYAFRVERRNFRGAAEALWEHIQHLKLSQAHGLRGADVDEEMMQSYLGCINALCVVEEKMRWLLVRPVNIPSTKTSLGKSVVLEKQINRNTRKLVTVDDVRREWQEFLDRQADLAAGRYALPLGEDEEDGMDFDEDEFLHDRSVPTNGLAEGMDLAPVIPQNV